MLENEFTLKNDLIIALDVDTAEDAIRLARLLAAQTGAFKVGPRLCMRYGSSLVETLTKLAPVFVDNKYFDIPSTVDAAVRATFAAGAMFATVHASNGKEALNLLAKTERELCRNRPFKVLAVTVLTSFTRETWSPSFVPQNAPQTAPTIEQSVELLAQLALANGLTGLVCSAQEVAKLRALFDQAFLVTPGVRLDDEEIGDQKRVETPAEAIRRGSNALVIGRPIIAAKDPVEAAERMIASINDGRRSVHLGRRSVDALKSRL